MGRLIDKLRAEIREEHQSQITELVSNTNDRCVFRMTTAPRMLTWLRASTRGFILQGMTTALRKIDQVREAVNASKIPDAEKQSRLKALDNARQMFLGHADGLNNLLFARRTAWKAATSSKSTGVPWGVIPFRPPAQAGVPQ